MEQINLFINNSYRTAFRVCVLTKIDACQKNQANEDTIYETETVHFQQISCITIHYNQGKSVLQHDIWSYSNKTSLPQNTDFLPPNKQH